MSSMDNTKKRRPTDDDDGDGDSGSNCAGHDRVPGRTDSSNSGRGGKCPRIGQENEQSSRASIDSGNNQATTNDGDEDPHETIRLLRQQIQEKNRLLQQIQEQNEQIQEQNEQIQKFNRFSFETLLAADEGNFVVTNETTPFSHVKGDHIGARTTEVGYFILHIPDAEDVRSIIRQSAFVLKFRNLDGSEWIPKAYGSEADICSFVSAAVQDAITLAVEEGIADFDELTQRLERSLFGCRPDIMVIRGKDGIGLVAIEVKKPLPENSSTKLIEYEHVVGHGYDQAQAMNAFGQGISTVVITSFNESYLCSLEQDGLTSAEPSNQLLQDDMAEADTPNQLSPFDLAEGDTSNQNIQDDVAETKNSVTGYIGTPTGPPRSFIQKQPPPAYKSPAVPFDHASESGSTKSSPAASVSGHSTGSSPDAKTGSTSQTSRMSTFLAEQNLKDDRILYATQMYKQHKLVTLLYNAIKISKSKYKNSTRKILKLQAGNMYEFPKALRVVDGEKENYWWGELKATLGQEIESEKYQSKSRRTGKKNKIDNDDDKSYYIIGSLGHGSTSNVFQALTSKGQHVAIKVYVKKYANHGKVLDEKSLQDIAMEAVDREKDRLLLFYPELLKDKVWTAKLFGRPCVVMPFFDPLETSVRKEESTLKGIHSILSGPFLTNRLRYKQEDERWRHVGKYTSENGQTHLILYDLADLQEVDEDSDKSETFIMEAVATFEHRIGIEEEQKHHLNVK